MLSVHEGGGQKREGGYFLQHTVVTLRELLDLLYRYILKLKTMSWAILKHCSLRMIHIFHHHKVIEGLINSLLKSIVAVLAFMYHTAQSTLMTVFHGIMALHLFSYKLH